MLITPKRTSNGDGEGREPETRKHRFPPEGPNHTTPKGKKKRSIVESSREHAPPKPKNYYGKGAPKGL